MSEAGSLSKYTPSVDEMVRALSYWGSMTREEARAAVNRRIDFIEAAALREAAVAMRAHKDPGHWNLRDERDPANASQSPDAWLEVRADRIESQETP